MEAAAEITVHFAVILATAAMSRRRSCLMGLSAWPRRASIIGIFELLASRDIALSP
jgi:hypothetical protein